jgi:signal transduction histidine kinase
MAINQNGRPATPEPFGITHMVDSIGGEANEALLDLQIQTFYQVNRFISSIHDMDQLLILIMQESESAVDAEASCIALHDPADGQLHIEYAIGEASAEVRRITLAMGQGVLGTVAATGKTLRVDDVTQDQRFDSSVDRKSGFITKSLLATPIQWRGNLLGVLEVVNKRGGGSFNQNDERLLEIVANQAAITLENSRLVDGMVKSERLSAIGNMAASIMADFKSPLTDIRGFAQLLANPEIDAERRKWLSDMILEDVDRYLGMAQELLDYSKGAISLNLKVVQIGAWLDRLTDHMPDDLAEASIKFSTNVNFARDVIMDEARVRRVVLNLVANAVKAMPQGGELTIATEEASGETGGHWQLTVADTGPGIPLDLRPRVFELSVDTGGDTETGLGLAIAKEVIDGHGGRISFETRTAGEADGQEPGTVFQIEMPVSPNQTG